MCRCDVCAILRAVPITRCRTTCSALTYSARSCRSLIQRRWTSCCSVCLHRRGVRTRVPTKLAAQQPLLKTQDMAHFVVGVRMQAPRQDVPHRAQVDKHGARGRLVACAPRAPRAIDLLEKVQELRDSARDNTALLEHGVHSQNDGGVARLQHDVGRVPRDLTRRKGIWHRCARESRKRRERRSRIATPRVRTHDRME